MAKKNNRKCICCSIEYRYCNTCAEDRNKELWYSIYHNENCKNIFNIISSYVNKSSTKEEAKKRILECDLSYKDNLTPELLSAVNELIKEEKKAKNIETIEETETVEEIVVEKKNFKKK